MKFTSNNPALKQNAFVSHATPKPYPSGGYSQNHQTSMRSKNPQEYSKSSHTRQGLGKDRDMRESQYDYQPEIFTFLDKTVLRFNTYDVYKQAAMVLRDKNTYFENICVMFPGMYAQKHDKPNLTLENFSKAVDEVVKNRIDDYYFYRSVNKR